jgi:hypothetical protein
MKAPVGWVEVLSPAAIAERQFGHRRCWPVIGQANDDGESWTAVRAAYERVPVSPVRRICKLGEALVASGDIGGHKSSPGARERVADAESGTALAGDVVDSHSVNRS